MSLTLSLAPEHDLGDIDPSINEVIISLDMISRKAIFSKEEFIYNRRKRVFNI